MSIYINNDTDQSVSEYEESVVLAGEKALGGVKAEVGVTFVTGEVIRELNARYREIDSVTDVLSFPAGEAPDGTLYGDIFICLERALLQAKEIGNAPRREVCFLVVHGVLHLLGYDHYDVSSEALMINKQKEIMGDLL